MTPSTTAPDLIPVDEADLGAIAAIVVARAVRAEPEGILGVATGRTPERLYTELSRLSRSGLDCSRLTLAALDEYVGIAPDDPRSYRSYVLERIARPLGIPDDRVLMPSIDPHGDVRYDELLAQRGGVALQILGIGRNGHIGFNEPGSAADSRARIVALTDTTRADNADLFGGDPAAVPALAITQGVGTILAARRLLLLASGAAKRGALRDAFFGPVTPDLPASALQSHPAVTIVADRAAAGIDDASAAHADRPPR